MTEHVSPKQLAQAIQVSESSVKRWCDQGVIATVRTAGGHRRIPVVDALRFLRDRDHPLEYRGGAGLPLPSGRRRLPLEQAAESFRHALLTGDEAAARRIVLDLLATPTSEGAGIAEFKGPDTLLGRLAADAPLTAVLEQVMTPALHEIGRLWSCGAAEVYQERRSCEISLRILHEVRRLLPPPRLPVGLAMGATPEGDVYQVASAMVELVLHRGGWETIALGTALPFGTLQAALRQYRPRLFWLSVSQVAEEQRFVREVRDLQAAVTPPPALVMGGRAVTDGLRQALPGVHHCASLRQLEALAQTLVLGPA